MPLAVKILLFPILYTHSHYNLSVQFIGTYILFASFPPIHTTKNVTRRQILMLDTHYYRAEIQVITEDEEDEE